MRVIGGMAKGRRLRAPKGRAVRPTADRVKESLFSILPRDLSGARVLDLFAGSGSLSAEALSRGAAEAVLIDSARGAAQAIKTNLAALEFGERARVWIAPVAQALRRLSRTGERFDLIFVDPPYEKNWVDKTLRAIAAGDLLWSEGIVVVEHSARERVATQYGPLVLRDQRRYGSTVLSFFSATTIS
jgi:16S rRNA (guanine(966)-N(2))-methyltransferase RsmD